MFNPMAYRQDYPYPIPDPHDIWLSTDRSQNIYTAGNRILYANPRRVWAAFTNCGPGYIDIKWDIAVNGQIRLLQGGSIVFSIFGDMPWFGSVDAAAQSDYIVLKGVEVEVIPHGYR